MADVDDIHNASHQVERQHEKLADADIDTRDRDAIERFIRFRRVNSDSYATHTEIADLSKLRLAADRASVPLVEMGLDDVTALFDALARPKGQGGYGVTSDSGLDNYARPIRLFFEWLDAHDEEGAYGWYEQINTSRHSLDRYDADDQLTPSEVATIREAARSNNTVRDRAIVSFYADTAVRLSLGGQLRRKHVDLSGDRPTFQPNPNGEGQKGVEIRDYPLYDCVADLRVWLEDHHPDDNPEAPVWTKEGYDPANPDDGALSTQRLGGVIRDRVLDAGIDKPSNPHNFRHSKVADMRARGYTPDEIQRRTAWADSVVADMLQVYGRPDDDDVLANIDEREGRAPPTDAVEDGSSGPEPRTQCGMCGLKDIAPGAQHCPRCGDAVGAEARRAEQAKSTLKDDAIDAIMAKYDTSALDTEGEQAVQAILQTVDDPDAVAPVLIQQFSD